jgi:hypothetical protein
MEKQGMPFSGSKKGKTDVSNANVLDIEQWGVLLTDQSLGMKCLRV